MSKTNLTQVRNSLILPGGQRHSLHEKDVIHINKLELSMLARFHEFAQKYGVAVVCQRCDSAIRGGNADTDSYMAVACQCREWRYTGG